MDEDCVEARTTIKPTYRKKGARKRKKSEKVKNGFTLALGSLKL